MNGAILEKIYNARVQLRAAGERDTQDAVREITGGSKSTLVKYWAQSDPATYTPSVTAGSREASTPSHDVTPSAHANGDTSPVAAVATTDDANEDAFEATFAVYLDATSRFHAVSGIRRYALPERHPKYQHLQEAAATAYNAHMEAWAVLEDREEAARPAPEPAPEPPPPPALDLTNIRAYYRSGGPAPWPPGAPWPDAGAPPLEAYPLLKELYRETDALVVKSWQAWMQTRNERGQVRGVPDETPVRQAEDRMSAQRLLQYRLKSDMDQVERNAESRGVPLPT